MIFYHGATTNVVCNDNVFSEIYQRMYYTTSGQQYHSLTPQLHFSGIISEGLFKVITMFNYNADNTFLSNATYANNISIRNIRYCIFGAYGHYNGGYYEGNHLCGSRLAESDEIGIHWTFDQPGTQEMNGFVHAYSSFNQPVKLVGAGYTNNIADSPWWTDASNNKWEAPIIMHTNFATSYMDFETFALNMNEKNIGTGHWKKEKMSAPSTGLRNYRTEYNTSAGAYNDMSTTEKNRYISQLSPYIKGLSNTDMFKLDVIEKTDGSMAIGASTAFFQNSLEDLAKHWGNINSSNIADYNFYKTTSLTGDLDYFRAVGNLCIEPQEYVIPVLFGKVSNSHGQYGFSKITPKFEYNETSMFPIFTLAKICVYENLQRQTNGYKEPLSIYTINGGQSHIFSDAIDLRNISTSGATRGKTVVNNGDIVAIAMGKVYIVSEQQIIDYVFPTTVH